MTDSAPGRDRAWRAIVLPPADGLALLGGDDDPWTEWARAVSLSVTGDHRGATRTLLPLTEGAGEVNGLAAAAVASIMRQLGDHRRAVGFDELAIGAPGAARVDGLVGRAADEVGMLNAESARLRLSRTRPVLSGWRDEVRSRWVGTEVELLSARADRARPLAARAVQLSEEAGARRHAIKSRIFAAACAADPAQRRITARRALGDAAALDLRPLTIAAALVLGVEALSDRERAAAGAAALYVQAHLPKGLGEGWQSRPEIVSLFAAPPR